MIFLECFNGFQQIYQNIFFFFFTELTTLIVQCRIADRRAELFVLFIVKVIKFAEFVNVLLLFLPQQPSWLDFLLEYAKKFISV